MSLPFQAIECYIAEVEPIDSSEGWPVEATEFLEDLARGKVCDALVAGYEADGVPYVNLYYEDLNTGEVRYHL